jgi:hypothetical protein
MNQKIESTSSPNTQQTSEFSSDFIRLLVALTAATLLLVFAFEHRAFTTFEHRAFPTPKQALAQMYLFPWVVAGGHTIANGLSEFSGESPSSIVFAERLAALLGLLFGFVIGPTLFFFGWYSRRQDRESGSKGSILKGSAIISVIGGILTFAVAIPSIPGAYTQIRVSEYLHRAQATQDNKDQMINDLSIITYNAKQFRILPKSLDGGNGSYLGYTLSQPLAGTENGTYEISCTADDIAVKGVSKKYSDCRVSVHVDKEGHMVQWEYSGDFR